MIQRCTLIVSSRRARRRLIGRVRSGHGDGAALATLGDEDLAMELQGEVGRRFPRLFWAGRGRNDELDGELRTAAMLCRGGGVPEALGGSERVEELRHGERKLAAGSTRAETCQRWGLRGEPELRGSNGGGHGRGSGRARLGLIGTEREGGEGGRKHVLREPHGAERAEGAGSWRRGTRHGSARRRRGASGSRPRRARREMVPRGEVEKLRGGTRGTARGRRRDGDERRDDGVATGKKEMVARAIL